MLPDNAQNCSSHVGEQGAPSAVLHKVRGGDEVTNLDLSPAGTSSACSVHPRCALRPHHTGSWAAASL